jgi:capsular polysaccharide export protein
LNLCEAFSTRPWIEKAFQMPRFLFVDLCAQFVPLFSHLARTLREMGGEVWFAAIEDAKAHLLLNHLREPVLFGRSLGGRHATPLSRGELEESVREHWEVNRTGVEDVYFHRYLVEHAARSSGVLDYFLERYKPDAVIVWNGLTGAGRLAVELARRRGLDTWFFENGFFPWTLQCDPRGVNFQNSVSPLPGGAFDHVQIDSQRFQTFIADLRTGRSPDFAHRSETSKRIGDGIGLALLKARRAHYLEWLPNWREHMRLRRSFRARTMARPQIRDQVPISEPYVFVPLQVSNDTQICSYSPHLPDMNSLIELVHGAWCTLNRPKLRLVVKEHPAESASVDYTETRKRYPDIYWIRAGPTREWLARAAAVVTINSTAGVEALALGRPVVTLGKAFYNKDGIVLHCSEPAQLASRLVTALGQAPPTDRTERFIYFLRFHYLIEGSWRAWGEETVSAIARRLTKTDPSLPDPLKATAIKAD